MCIVNIEEKAPSKVKLGAPTAYDLKIIFMNNMNIYGCILSEN